MKTLIYTTKDMNILLEEFTRRYMEACNMVSQYIFDNGFILNTRKIQDILYKNIRDSFGLKSQMSISVIKTACARYKTVETQLQQKPYRYKDENDEWKYIPKTLEWLQKPVMFKRPQADLVRGRDYSFVQGGTCLSINTLGKRITVPFEKPECFESYFDGSWKFGGAKLVSLKGNWYLHISMTKEIPSEMDETKPSHVVGIDRGLRFLATTYDETGKCFFFDGKPILKKRNTYNNVRAELQSKGTKSAKRILKRLSERENRWMSDINHQISKTLVDRYGSNTLFVVEDLTGVSFDETILSKRTAKGRNEIRSWAFYQLEQFLKYKAESTGSALVKVDADYTSQRCPKCGRIHKENRKHETHEYICDACGYRSNDDRIGAMNIYQLGTMYVSGDVNPRFGSRRVNGTQKTKKQKTKNNNQD